MAIPKEITEVVEDVAAKYQNDIPAAVTEAVKRIKRLTKYEEFVGGLLKNSIQELVYDARHKTNVKTKRQAGYYGGKAKVVAGASVEEAYQSCYAYCIGGMTLGEIKGTDLRGIGEREGALAKGHTFNRRLCEELAKVVPDEKAVKEAINEKKLRGIFKRVDTEIRAVA